MLNGSAPAVPRSLISVVANWLWPASTVLELETQRDVGQTIITESSATEVILLAGLVYKKIAIKSSTIFSSDHDSARLKLSSDLVDRTRCDQSTYDRAVGLIVRPDNAGALFKAGAGVMGMTNGPVALTNAGDNLNYELSSSSPAQTADIVFMNGGIYKLCYAPDGVFTGASSFKNNVVPAQLKVIGVSAPCNTDGCMETQRWECSFGFKGEDSADCSFDLKADGGRRDWSLTPGDVSKMTWTSRIYDGQPKICRESAPETTIIDTTSTGLFLTLDLIEPAAVMPPVRTTQMDAFTLAACYCPNYDATKLTSHYCSSTDTASCCDNYQEYIQQFGIIYYWTIRICDEGFHAQCNQPYMRVVPQQKFVLRVECPPVGGCLANSNNRIKYITHQTDIKASWSRTHACKTILGESARAVWPSPSDPLTLSGGARTDYKVWSTKQVKINFGVKQKLDVCYTNAEADGADGWFRIGTIRTADNFAFASRTHEQIGSAIQSLTYVNWPGAVTLYGGIATSADAAATVMNPYDANQYSGQALLNVISFDRDENYGIGNFKSTFEQYNNYHRMTAVNFQDVMDRECQREDYNPTLIEGVWNKIDSQRYMAKVTQNRFMPFSGENGDQTMTITRAGVVAICYCAMLSGQAQLSCSDPSNWVYAGRLTIRGPAGMQNWVFPLDIVVRMELQGWGFSNADRLRIIPSSSSCSDSSNNPAGSQAFKLGCPSTPVPAQGTLGCRLATTSESINLRLVDATSTVRYITAVETAVTYTTVTFDGSIQGILEEDDIITIDGSMIRVNGLTEAQMNEAQKFDKNKLAGQIPFQDDLTKSYLVGHRVGFVVVNDVIDYTKINIPVGWPLGAPAFTFHPGHWTRVSKEDTATEIKGIQAETGLKVCWGVEDGTTRFYSQAGTLNFEAPAPMPAAKLSLTTKQRDARAPVVLSFTTGANRSEYGATRMAPTKLMLRFLDVSIEGKLIPLYAGDVPVDGDTNTWGIPDAFEVLPEGKKQWVCGRLFSELWSSDPEGFPMPSGCYISPKYRDNVQGGQTQNFYREVTISFPAGSGLKNNTDYQIVLNAIIKGITLDDPLVDVYAMCDGTMGCHRPFQVYEKGTAMASMSTEMRATASDPNFAVTDGIVLQHTNADGVLNLSERNIIQVNLAGGDNLMAITRGCHVRLYLWPLTTWTLEEGHCEALCMKYHIGNRVCNGQVGCMTEEVVLNSSRRNVARLTLPSAMDDITSTIRHTVVVQHIALPAGGFFPIRLGAQLTRPDDTAPDYRVTTGMYMKTADAGTTTGRLVVADRTGYGPRPFQGDQSNLLYVRISFGATVWNNGESNAAYVDITLPEGYTCSVQGEGTPPWDLAVFTNDLDGDGHYDSARGYLSVDSADGEWNNLGDKVCQYRLKQYQAIYAGMVVFVNLTAHNPSTAMQKLETTTNVWHVKLSSKGIHRSVASPYAMNEEPFITLAQEMALGPDLWQGNVAVLAPLTYQTLQPTNFRRSIPTLSVSQDIYVFFRTTLYVGRDGFVVLDAPDGFDFGMSCQAGDLPTSYYAFRGVTEDLLVQLAKIQSCTGLKYPSSATTYNRARIKVGGIIDATQYYGFKVNVTHPLDYATSQQDGWFIWTQDKNGYGLEGTPATVLFNRDQPVVLASQGDHYDLSWGLYNEAFFTNFYIEVADMSPELLSGALTTVTVWPFTFDIFTSTSLRITAPLGFEWDTDTGNSFTPSMNVTTANDIPVPTVLGNQLLWPTIEFRHNEIYGFSHKIKVPAFSPVISTNAFFAELGYNRQDITERSMATMVPANPVKAMTNCYVGYETNLRGYSGNPIEFRFQTVTRLAAAEGIVIKGDANTQGFILACPAVALPGSAPLPSDIRCTFEWGQSDGLPQLSLYVDTIEMQPGYYMVELLATNPDRKILTSGNWQFGTYQSARSYPNAPNIDNVLTGPGFAINGPILDAKLMTISDQFRALTGRNDRPGKPNSLIFQFSVREAPTATSNLKLRGPRGFVFAEDCLSGVVTAPTDVFGPNTQALWPDASILFWPSGSAPTACAGDGRFATITIPPGMTRRLNYAFRIAVERNPDATPEWNKWTIDFVGESSDPFLSFTVWTFINTLVMPVSLAKSPTGANIPKTVNPVKITFQPYNTVPAMCIGCASGGLLRLTAPMNFEFVHMNGACNAVLFETGTTSYYGVGDISCTVQPTRHLFLELSGTRSVQGGRDYTLVVEVYNPTTADSASQWALDSFTQRSAEPQTALDEVMMMGSDINNVLNTWIVDNKFNRFDGKTSVSDVDITMQFPDALKDSDQITIVGPTGFDLIGNPDLNNCKEFRWPTGQNPLPTSPDPTCTCANNICTMVFNIMEFQDPALAQNTDIMFTIATTNPASTPFITENFWRVNHTRFGVVRSSHVTQSWMINPQLENVVISLAGPNQAAGSESDLIFQFTAVNNANTVRITALFPLDFDFGKATVNVPYDIDDRSDRATIIINHANIEAGRVSTIRINQVKLGVGGGQTRFDITTFTDDSLLEKRDEKLGYEGGFRLPGRITVLGQELKSRFQEERSLYPVKSLLEARIGEEAKAEFVLTFSREVYAAEKLVISCQGEGAYELKTLPFVIIGSERVESVAELTPGTLSELQATLKPGRPATEVALQADTSWTIIMWVVPQRGTNSWLFQTIDSGTYPTNTNDGATQGFTPVEQFGLTVNAARSPPRAIIDVELNIDQQDAVVLELLVIAPPAFIFPPTGCGEMCQAGQALGTTGRRTATIASPTGHPLTGLANLKIQVQTPEVTPSTFTWFVEGRGQGTAATTGWGEAPGFRVNQMADSVVTYGAVSGLKSTEITFSFRVEVQAGVEIMVEPPSGYLLSCSTEGSLRMISLPGEKPGCTDDPLVLLLTEMLAPGMYAFAVAVDLPLSTPDPNTFNLILRDRDKNVVDAAYALPGSSIVSIPAGSPTLAWDRNAAGQPAMITVGVSFTSSYTQLKAVLITFPDGFEHIVERPTDVQSLNRFFPVAASQASGWADTTEDDRIKILVDDSNDITIVDPGAYEWTFPVRVPVNEPRINLWYLSLCSDRLCSQPLGSNVFVSFPLAGFSVGDPIQGVSAANGASRRSGGIRPVGLLLALCMAAAAGRLVRLTH